MRRHGAEAHEGADEGRTMRPGLRRLGLALMLLLATTATIATSPPSVGQGDEISWTGELTSTRPDAVGRFVVDASPVTLETSFFSVSFAVASWLDGPDPARAAQPEATEVEVRVIRRDPAADPEVVDVPSSRSCVGPDCAGEYELHLHWPDARAGETLRVELTVGAHASWDQSDLPDGAELTLTAGPVDGLEAPRDPVYRSLFLPDLGATEGWQVTVESDRPLSAGHELVLEVDDDHEFHVRDRQPPMVIVSVDDGPQRAVTVGSRTSLDPPRTCRRRPCSFDVTLASFTTRPQDNGGIGPSAPGWTLSSTLPDAIEVHVDPRPVPTVSATALGDRHRLRHGERVTYRTWIEVPDHALEHHDVLRALGEDVGPLGATVEATLGGGVLPDETVEGFGDGVRIDVRSVDHASTGQDLEHTLASHLDLVHPFDRRPGSILLPNRCRPAEPCRLGLLVTLTAELEHQPSVTVRPWVRIDVASPGHTSEAPRDAPVVRLERP